MKSEEPTDLPVEPLDPYGMVASSPASPLASLGDDCDQTGAALVKGSGMYVATDNNAMRPG